MVLYKDLSYKVIGCALRVHGSLGPELLEQCYHNTMFYELQETGLSVKYNVPYNVEYKGNRVGEYYADLLVDDKIILELKSVKQFSEVHSAQLINYLHIAGCKVGYLLNFQGCQLEWKRFVL